MPTAPIRFADIEIDPRRRELQRAGVAVAVESRVFDLLLYLIEHRDRAVGKHELQDAVWAGRIVTEAALTAHPWSFTLKRARLAEIAGEPLADFGVRFALPDDFLRAIYLDNRGSSPRHAVFGREIHTNARDVVLTYQRRPEESAFPPFFRSALVARLAAELCIPITESTARAEALDRLAERELERAWAIARAQETPPLVTDDSLLRVRSCWPKSVPCRPTSPPARSIRG